jgi:hypothetical protein
MKQLVTRELRSGYKRQVSARFASRGQREAFSTAPQPLFSGAESGAVPGFLSVVKSESGIGVIGVIGGFDSVAAGG